MERNKQIKIIADKLAELKESQGLWADEYKEDNKGVSFRIGYKSRYTEVLIRFSDFDTDMISFKESMKENYPKKIKT